MSRPAHPTELLPAFTAGLLDPAEEEVVLAHLRTCGPCGALADALGTGDALAAEEVEHLPADLLARWGRARESLRGLERDLVRTHLDRCSRCREELELLGFPPGLGAEDGARQATPMDDPGRQAPVRRPEVRVVRGGASSRRSWATWWAVGGWATAAAVIAVLVVSPRTMAPLPGGSLIDGSAGTPMPVDGALAPLPPAKPSPAPPVARPARLDLAAVASLPPSLRGAEDGDSLLTTEVSPTTRWLALTPPELPDVQGPVILRLIGPDGTLLATRRTTAADLRRTGAAIVFDAGDAPLASGVYHMAVRFEIQHGEASASPIERAFRLRRAGR